MKLEQLKRIVNESEDIVFFGGAGTSTESGIPDFRSAEGLYESEKGGRYAPEEILSRDFFIRHPDEFYRFYKSKMIHANAKPNAGHLALAQLEREGRLKAVITQNIDGLHQAAGSRNVLELHGSVHRNGCMNCGKSFGLEAVIDSPAITPKCDQCGGTIKPDVVLYQENLDTLVIEQAIESISNADVLIVAGTSLTVYPAAGFVRYYRGDKFVLINKSETSYDGVANLVIQDSIAKVLHDVVS